MNVKIMLCCVLHFYLVSNVFMEKNSTRSKRKWIWSELMNQPHGSETTTRRLKRGFNANDCDTNVPKPDFHKPNRRIAEVKCLEYIWERKKREIVAQKTSECFHKWLESLGDHRPHFAVGGRPTSPGEFPHMGAVGWKAIIGTWIFKCGATLISSKFLVTAAHCSASPGDSNVANIVPEIVRLGDKNIIDVYANDQFPVDVKIINIIVHPNYKAPLKYFDIALLEVSQHVEFTKFIQPACIWSNFDTSRLGTKATLTGWGVIETATRKTSPELQAAEVDVIDSGFCDSLLRPSCNRHWCGIENHQICAGKLEGGVDACQGDSGGPLQVKISLPPSNQGSMHFLIGVTSFGIGCARPNLPGVYTRVSSFVDWIENIVWPENI